MADFGETIETAATCETCQETFSATALRSPSGKLLGVPRQCEACVKAAEAQAAAAAEVPTPSSNEVAIEAPPSVDQAHGGDFLETLQRMMAKEKRLVAPPTVLHWCDVPKRSGPAMLVDGVWPAVGLGLLFADPETGKSAYAVALAGAVASGAGTLFGSAINRRGPVVFLLAEGQSQFYARLAAEAEAHGIRPRDLPVYTYEEPLDFSDTLAVGRIVEALRPIAPVTVFVDSAISHDPGVAGGQHDSATQGATFGGMNQIAQALDCLLIVLDHPGHTDKTRPAGSFAKLAKVDAAWRMYREAKTGTVVMAPAKSKDFAVSRSTRIRLSIVSAPNGAPLLVQSDRDAEPQELSPTERRSLTVVSRLSETSEEAGGVTDAAWLRESLNEGIKRASHYRAKTRLLDAGFVAKRGALHAVTESGLALVSNGLTPVSGDGVRPNPFTRPSLPGASLTHPVPPKGTGAGETAPGGGLERSQRDEQSLSEAA